MGLRPSAKWLARFAGGAGALITAYELWTWLNQPEGQTTEQRLRFWAGEAGVWSYDPRFGPAPEIQIDPQNNGIEYIQVPLGRQTGGPPLLGEYVWSIVSTFPVGSVANINAWNANGRRPAIVTRDEVCTQAREFPVSPTLDYYRNLVVGSADVNLPFNSKLVLTLRIERTAGLSFRLQAIPHALFWAAQPLPWSVGDMPLTQPFGSPVTAAPRPVAFAPPRLDPWSPEMPDVGPRPAPRPDAPPANWPDPWPGYDPVANPVPEPMPQPLPEPIPGLGPNFGVNPRGVGAVSYSPLTGARPVASAGARPPGKHTKERKAGLPPWASFVWRAAGHITEAVDTIDAVYEALPKSRKIAEYKKRGRQPNPFEKLRIIYDNIGEVNMGDVVTNIISENIEDTVYGKAGQALTNAGKNMFPDRPIQLGAGPAL